MNDTRPLKLVIVSPVYNAVQGPSAASLVQTVIALMRVGVEVEYRSVWRDSNVPNARRMLSEEALRLEADRILWLDDDIVFDPVHLEKLLMANLGDDIVAGCYPIRKPNGGTVGTVTKDGETRGELVQMDHVGFGFTLVSRECLRRLVTTYGVGCFEFRKGPDGVLLGDDQVFSASWRALGGRIWAHTGVRLGHCGPHVFT